MHKFQHVCGLRVQCQLFYGRVYCRNCVYRKVTTKCVDPYINKLDVSSRITQKMSHLAIQRSRRRYIGPDARKDGTTVKARLRAGEDCEEWDLLLTDIPAVVASGVEVHSRNADFATPMFTEVTPRYIVNGVYAGVSIKCSAKSSHTRPRTVRLQRTRLTDRYRNWSLRCSME
mgnify:CR=1 FL=1